MDIINSTLQAMGVGNASIAEIRSKDGVSVYRVTTAHTSYILKYFAHEADRREIENYRMLQTLRVPTLSVVAHTDSALLLEAIAQSETLRLAVEADMHDPDIAARLAQWYKRLHAAGGAYVASSGAALYDETDVITPENMRYAAKQTHTEINPVWAFLDENFAAVRARIAALCRTLTYNDFYYTNMIVAKDRSAAFMFDYNLLGKGYVYADLRNVTSSLGSAAGDAFLQAYGDYDSAEILVDAVASPLTTLHFACKRNTFPGWAAEELEHVKDGTLEKAIKRLLS